MHFPLWAIKTDKPHLYYTTVNASDIDTSSFISESDVYTKNGRTTIALIFHYLDDILGGHKKRSIAWKQFRHSESILRKLSLRTKDAKAKPPSQVQQWLGKIFDTKKQWLSLPADKVKKYVSE